MYNSPVLNSFTGYTFSDGTLPSILYVFDSNADYDGDSLINSDELLHNTDLFITDTDNDTFTDG